MLFILMLWAMTLAVRAPKNPNHHHHHHHRHEGDPGPDDAVARIRPSKVMFGLFCLWSTPEFRLI